MGQAQDTQGYRPGIEPARRGLGYPPEANALPIEPRRPHHLQK